MTSFPPRHAISRAEFFLLLASECSATQRKEFEAFLEAAIIFGRTAIHRIKSEFERNPGWSCWFAGLRSNPSIEFFREHRDVTLKEAPPKVGQRIGFQPALSAAELYFFEPNEFATATVRNHLSVIANLVQEASNRFGQLPSA